jgi:hypothetical protein
VDVIEAALPEAWRDRNREEMGLTEHESGRRTGDEVRRGRRRRHQPDQRLRYLYGHEQQEFHADRPHAVGEREYLKRHQDL